MQYLSQTFFLCFYLPHRFFFVHFLFAGWYTMNNRATDWNFVLFCSLFFSHLLVCHMVSLSVPWCFHHFGSWCFVLTILFFVWNPLKPSDVIQFLASNPSLFCPFIRHVLCPHVVRVMMTNAFSVCDSQIQEVKFFKNFTRKTFANQQPLLRQDCMRQLRCVTPLLCEWLHTFPNDRLLNDVPHDMPRARAILVWKRPKRENFDQKVIKYETKKKVTICSVL